jgi:hypothetical protein
MPVSYGNAELSIPHGWITLTTDCPYGSAPGAVIVRNATYSTGCVAETGPGIANIVRIAPDAPPVLVPNGRRTTINGVPVYWGHPNNSYSAGYQAPSLGVQIDVYGPLARTVLETLSRSRGQ